MSEFSVRWDKLKSNGENISLYKSTLQTYSNKISKIAKKLPMTSQATETIRENLKSRSRSVSNLADKMGNMGKTLVSAADVYYNTENKYSNRGIDATTVKKLAAAKYIKDSSIWAKIKEFFGWGEAFTEDEIDSVVFDDDGSYGGDQGAPQNERGFWSEKSDLYDIVKKYYPNMTDQEIYDYLKKLNSEGCGYVAVINTIFAAYEGREEEFEKIFGFSMYNNNGDLNYNKLIVDFYSATDNHNLDSNGSDSINNNEDQSSVKGAGVTANSLEYRAKLFLNEKGVNVDVEIGCDVTIDNFNEYAENGYVVMSYFYGNLQNEDGSVVQYINGGHAMVVTGVTSDGRFIVSSWGEKYYIDPEEIVIDGLNSTDIGFSYYQYS